MVTTVRLTWRTGKRHRRELLLLAHSTSAPLTSSSTAGACRTTQMSHRGQPVPTDLPSGACGGQTRAGGEKEVLNCGHRHAEARRAGAGLSGAINSVSASVLTHHVVAPTSCCAPASTRSGPRANCSRAWFIQEVTLGQSLLHGGYSCGGPSAIWRRRPTNLSSPEIVQV